MIMIYFGYTQAWIIVIYIEHIARYWGKREVVGLSTKIANSQMMPLIDGRHIFFNLSYTNISIKLWVSQKNIHNLKERIKHCTISIYIGWGVPTKGHLKDYSMMHHPKIHIQYPRFYNSPSSILNLITDRHTCTFNITH